LLSSLWHHRIVSSRREIVPIIDKLFEPERIGLLDHAELVDVINGVLHDRFHFGGRDLGILVLASAGWAWPSGVTRVRLQSQMAKADILLCSS
jgi:hypothetical protein